MAIYKVREGCTVNWPDGTLRAEAGEYFDGFDTEGSPSANALASTMLFNERGKYDPEVGAPVRRSCSELIQGYLEKIKAEPTRELEPEAAPAKKKAKKTKKAASAAPAEQGGENID